MNVHIDKPRMPSTIPNMNIEMQPQYAGYQGRSGFQTNPHPFTNRGSAFRQNPKTFGFPMKIQYHSPRFLGSALPVTRTGQAPQPMASALPLPSTAPIQSHRSENVRRVSASSQKSANCNYKASCASRRQRIVTASRSQSEISNAPRDGNGDQGVSMNAASSLFHRIKTQGCRTNNPPATVRPAPSFLLPSARSGSNLSPLSCFDDLKPCDMTETNADVHVHVPSDSDPSVRKIANMKRRHHMPATPETLSGASGLLRMKLEEPKIAVHRDLYDSMKSNGVKNPLDETGTNATTSHPVPVEMIHHTYEPSVPIKKRRVAIDLTHMLSSDDSTIKTEPTRSQNSSPSLISTQTASDTPSTSSSSIEFNDDTNRVVMLERFIQYDQGTQRQRRPTKLALPTDAKNVNSLHKFVRSSLLELFVLEADSDRMTGCHFPGRVGLRCVHCKHLPKDKQEIGAVFYPKSLKGLYRNVCTWQRVHFQTCSHVPKEDKDMHKKLKDDDKTRGRTKYWESSAMELGLVDTNGVQGRGGIMFQCTDE